MGIELKNAGTTRMWIRVGAFAGLVASLSYPALLLIPLPLVGVVTLASLFGLSLSIAALGGYYFYAIHRKTVSLQLGTAAMATAGVLVNCMLIIQFAVSATLDPMLAEAETNGSAEMVRMIWRAVDQVQLGLDVAWDIYISVGTLLIAWNARHHPRFGPFFAWPGLVLAFLLLVLNLYTFPTPPAQAELFDLGPLLGLWSLVMTIRLLCSLKWADEVIGLPPI
jgi:hypothetical protein